MERWKDKWEIVGDAPCALGEGPVWDHRTKRLYWVDILGCKIHAYDTVSRSTSSFSGGTKMGSFTLTNTPDIVVTAQKDGLYEMDLRSGIRTFISNPEEALPNNRFNDGKTDRFGNFWAGTMDEVHNRKGAGALYMLNKNLEIVQKLDHLSCSNGLAWSMDNRKFYLIDTGVRTLYAFDYNTDTYTLDNQQVVRQFDDSEGIPDGMCIDREGMLWIAHWNGYKVARYDPLSGEQLLAVRLPASRITSCCFGGDNLNDLYITSARTGLSEQELEEQPLAGSVFVLKDLPYTGLLSNIFPL